VFDYTPVPQDQIRQFDEEGYLVVRNVLDEASIATLLEASDRLIASDIQTSRQSNPTGLYDGFRNSIALDDAYIPLMTHPKILPLVIHLLGSNLQLMTSHLIYKYPNPPGTPEHHRAPGWHRDYLQAMMALGHYSIPRIELKCAYYFTDLSQPKSGNTMVVPGSNQATAPLAVPEDGDPDGAIEPLLNPGDCLLFENRTWHAGAVNLSDHIRKGIMVGFGYRWVMPMDFRRQDPAFVEKLSPLERFLVGEQYDDVVNFQPDGGANPLADWCRAHGVPTARHFGPGNTVAEIY
jgi:ectoine hydroxylase-related dioxygenase (phytanoyl-CoA dioxygenase family)|tara:strand:+ start:3089 stop:3964 length:876 start_codon:yes stop_codon:yes gene_type:complete